MVTCPVCGREMPTNDVYPVHYTTGLFRCENSGQPVKTDKPAEKPKKAPAKKAAPKKSAKKTTPKKK